MTKLLLGITSHGFGHLAQSAPVIAELRRRRPDIELTVRTALPRAMLETRIAPPFAVAATDQDFGVRTQAPFAVDRAATYKSYAALHDGFDEKVDKLAAWLGDNRFDAVLTNMSYLLLAASHRAGVPSIGMSSLNWLDIFRHYCSGLERSEEIASQIRESYGKAAAICRLVPGMPMRDLTTTPIPEAIVSQGASHAERIRRAFGLPAGGRIVVFAFGGQSPDAPPPWSDAAGQGHLLFGPASWSRQGGPWRDPASAEVPFVDLLASADLVVTKAGYGVITELAAAGVPALLAHRGDWPEETHLAGWLEHYAPFEYIEGELRSLDFDEMLGQCDRMNRRRSSRRPSAGGEAHIADLLVKLAGWS